MQEPQQPTVDTTIVVMSRTTGAIVTEYGVYLPAEAVRQAMGRDPDFTDIGIISWGNVEIAEIERLMMDNDDPDSEGFEVISNWSEQYMGEGYFWSLFIDEKDYAE